jgi:hypothetical protein
MSQRREPLLAIGVNKKGHNFVHESYSVSTHTRMAGKVGNFSGSDGRTDGAAQGSTQQAPKLISKYS